jgi:hypothetical protein
MYASHFGSSEGFLQRTLKNGMAFPLASEITTWCSLRFVIGRCLSYSLRRVAAEVGDRIRRTKEQMTETERSLLTLAMTFVGSGLSTTIVGAFFKRRFDSQLETQKALLQRSGRIHERQVDALLAIHRSLEQALFCLQRAKSAEKFEGEADDRTQLARIARYLGVASKEFSKNRLLFSDILQGKLDHLFKEMFSVGMVFKFTLDTTLQGEGRAAILDQVRNASSKNLEPILRDIRIEARAVIHG